jgi:hypothetical protein
MNRVGKLVLCAWLAVPTLVMAQDNAWEVEVHAGGLFTPDVSGGTGSLPPVGSSFTTPGGFQSRVVSSWFFGDGAQLLNGVAGSNPGFNVSQRITPLDVVLNNPLADRTGGGSFGFRVSRQLMPRIVAEFNFDYASTPFEARGGVQSGLEGTAASFAPVFEALLPAPLFVGRNPRASSSLEIGDGSEIIVTGVVRINLLTQGRIIPYAAAGAGVTNYRGEGPVAVLDGGYSFLLFGVAPFNERDTVNMRQTFEESAPVGVFGGGVNVYLTVRSGIRVDARVHLGPARDEVLLNATPVVTVTPAGSLVFSSTNPSLSFNSLAGASTTLSPSSLSGRAITDFKTFEASGTRQQVLLSVGYFYRF